MGARSKLTVAFATLFCVASSYAQQLHPLDPLTAQEYQIATTTFKNFRPGQWTFSLITLQEPAKSTLIEYFLEDRDIPDGAYFPRHAFISAYETNIHEAYEADINLDTRNVERFTQVTEGAQPMINSAEAAQAKAIAYANSSVIARCAELGWTDMNLVVADAWYTGYVRDIEQYRNKRLMAMFMFGSNFPGDNHYAHPFDFIVMVDLDLKQVINIENLPTHEDFDSDNREGNVVPLKEANYDPVILGEDYYRKDVKPIRVTQPEGSGITVEGMVIKWQKFKMRLGYNAREGVVIHHLSYNDSGTVRPLFYRMSLAEMFVPYGDPRPPHHRKHAYDTGEYGLGFSMVELEPEVDCLGETIMIDAILHDPNGEPVTMRNAACAREEDAGILAKHYDLKTDRMTTIRSQRLSLTFIVNVDNYDYIVTWHLYQDATIECEAKATGILNLNMMAVNATPAGHGTIVSPQVNAQYHQHFFTLRLDADIDGVENTVVVQDVVPLNAEAGSPENPYGNGVVTDTRTLTTAGTGMTNNAVDKARSWIIRNPNKLNPNTGRPIGWKLVPWGTQGILVNEDSPILHEAEWMRFHTWVVPYKENQLYPGGFYLNGSGLHEWVKEDENASIENTDVVIWHSFGLTHIPRVEDYPLMPVETLGVLLRPVNFFNESPAMDVPPPKTSGKRKVFMKSPRKINHYSEEMNA